MNTILYFILWLIIVFILSESGITIDKKEFWIIFLSIIGIVMLKDIFLNQENNKKDGA